MGQETAAHLRDGGGGYQRRRELLSVDGAGVSTDLHHTGPQGTHTLTPHSPFPFPPPFPYPYPKHPYLHAPVPHTHIPPFSHSPQIPLDNKVKITFHYQQSFSLVKRVNIHLLAVNVLKELYQCVVACGLIDKEKR